MGPEDGRTGSLRQTLFTSSHQHIESLRCPPPEVGPWLLSPAHTMFLIFSLPRVTVFRKLAYNMEKHKTREFHTNLDLWVKD